jgi:hypothetical protein
MKNIQYAENVNRVGEKIDTIQKNTQALLYASKEVGLEVSAEKTKFKLMSLCKKPGQRHSIQIADGSFEDMEKLRYLGTTLTEQNCMHEEIKNKLNSRNACYYSIQTLLSSRLLSRNVTVKIYKTINLPVVLYECEA